MLTHTYTKHIAFLLEVCPMREEGDVDLPNKTLLKDNEK